MVNKASLLVTFVVLVLLQFSCHSSKELTSEVRNQVRPENMFQRLEKNSFKFDEMSAKLSVKYTADDKTTSFKAMLKIKKDSIIWISLKVGMVEVARVAILQDTIKMLMRTESKYFVWSRV